jgi:SAM-dependent methyltransferase
MDLRVKRSKTSGTLARHAWAEGQDDFESWDCRIWMTQSTEYYLAEIDSVREIYQREFQLSGTVVDVGGGRGTLRHYLAAGSTYLSVDPFSGQFANLESHPQLLAAYPCLAEPCRSVLGTAEHLPVRTEVADWVHLRSVLDHLYDPLVAVWESCRILKPGGSILVGMTTDVGIDVSEATPADSAKTIGERLAAKYRSQGTRGVVRAVAKRVSRAEVSTVEVPKDHHTWRPQADDVLDLFRSVGLTVRHVHWQKPPHTATMYVQAVKNR